MKKAYQNNCDFDIVKQLECWYGCRICDDSREPPRL